MFEKFMELIRQHQRHEVPYDVCHLHLHQEFVEALRQLGKPILDQFVGIPIIVNNSLGVAEWRLVDSVTSEVLTQGVIDALIKQAENVTDTE